VIGANRSGTGHRDFPVRAVDVADGAALRDLLTGADLVVNAVGPYRYDPEPLVAACIDARCHYADLAEDLSFLARVERVARTLEARKAGVTLLPGCSAVPGLVQVLASRLRGAGAVERVTAWLSLGSRNPVSRGLLSSLLAPIGRPIQRGGDSADRRRAFTRIEHLEMSDGTRPSFGPYPAPFLSAGIRVGERRVPVRFRVGFDRAFLNRAVALAAPLLGRLSPAFLERLTPLLLPLARTVRPLGTLRGVLAVVAEDARGEELDRIEVRARLAGLDVPAMPPVWVARLLAAKGTLPAAGVLGLDRVVSLEDAISWLTEAGYQVVRGRGDVG
jgi:hypothetical protein